MSLYNPIWEATSEPNQTNIRQWLDNMYSKFQPIEQARWNQSTIDTLFYAGNQSFVNRYFNFSPGYSYQQYYFNLIQQPVNMITGYQRQHRKQIIYVPTEGADSETTDQYSSVVADVCQKEGIHEQFSRSCEYSAIAGMNLMQPYLDYSNDDAAQGSLKVKIWEFNSFIVDPFFREPDMSDAQFVWCQEYISKMEAVERFEHKAREIESMSGSPQRYGNFYFLPENYNMSRNNLLVLSYVWYKSKRKRKKLYSKKWNQFFDFSEENAELELILKGINDLEVVEVSVPTWKVAVVLNDLLMFNGNNPLGFDSCPFIPVFWNYDPHISQYDLRVRSMVRPMRDPQFLFNYKVIVNNDITAATINAGWKRKSGAVANEDNLKKTGQGFDIVINEGYEMQDVEKILPSGVPESDMALAQQMADLIYNVSGINMENWSGQQDKQISSLTALIKQAANLLVFQKYFDQWDYALKLLGEKILMIILHNWNAQKIQLILGEEPTAHFFSRVFAKFKVLVEEGLMTPTQRNLHAQQLLDINTTFQREVFPPSMIVKDMNIHGRNEAVEYLEQQEHQAQVIQSEQLNLQHAFEEMKMKELLAKINNLLSQARERDSRSASNVGLFEERISEISKNHAISTREKMDALTKLLETIQKFGEVETFLRSNQLDSIKMDEEEMETQARADIEKNEISKNFVNQIFGTMGQQNQNPSQNSNMGL